MERVIIFDTTLRDGEQSPGVGFTVKEKLEIAKQLEKLRVDVIETGFPASSPGDFEAVKQIAQEVKNPIITALARAKKDPRGGIKISQRGGENGQGICFGGRIFP